MIYYVCVDFLRKDVNKPLIHTIHMLIQFAYLFLVKLDQFIVVSGDLINPVVSCKISFDHIELYRHQNYHELLNVQKIISTV